MTTLHEAAAAILSTLAAFAWLRHGLRDDADTAAAHEYVLDALSDADAVRTIDTITDGDLRAQLTVEQALALHEEARLARMGSERN